MTVGSLLPYGIGIFHYVFIYNKIYKNILNCVHSYFLFILVSIN